MLSQRNDVGRSVLAVDHHEVEAGQTEHLDDLLGRHPQQHPEKLLAVMDPALQRRRGHATMPADRSTSAPDMPGMPSIATTASPTSKARVAVSPMTAILDAQ